LASFGVHHDEKLQSILRQVAPGTTLREGLEQILRAKTGSLIVVSDRPEVMELIEGGFPLDIDFTPTRVYELAKMDGAIILTEDAKRIRYANVQLIPEPSIPSYETGIRHRSAERAAKQTGALVIAISQRRDVITVYKGGLRYVISDMALLLSKANQAIQTLEKYKSVLEQALSNLSALEFEDLVTLFDVVLSVQRGEMVTRISREIERYISELGNEGRLVSMQLEELVFGVPEEQRLVIADYMRDGEADADSVDEMMEELHQWTADHVMDGNQIARSLGYTGNVGLLEESVVPRGFRLLKKIPRLPMPVIENLVQRFGTLHDVFEATADQLDAVDGIGEVRARSIRDGLRRLREQVMLDRQL